MLTTDTLAVFVAVVDTGSFSAAAERFGQTPSGISRTISRLEAQLGMSLMTRTTRRQELTPEGAWLLERARRILADLQETETLAAAQLSMPSGIVRVNASTPVLNHLLAPLAAEFLELYPRVGLQLYSGETIVDLIEERADVAIRIGKLTDSSLHARCLGTSARRLLASPAYLAKHGNPKSVADLARHRLVGFTAPAVLNKWPLRDAGGAGCDIVSHVAASNGETLRHLALAGLGIVCLSDFLTRGDQAAGALIPVLPEETLPWKETVWAVYYKHGVLPPRVAAFLDFLADRVVPGLLDAA